MSRKPPEDDDEHQLVIAPSSAIANRPTLEQSPLALYLASLRSAQSRRAMLSALGRAAKIFDAFDHNLPADASTATAVSYPWHEPGALTFAKVQATVALVAEEMGADGATKAPMANLVRSALRGLASFAFNLRLISADDRMRIDSVKPIRLSGKTRGRRLNDAEIARLYDACHRDTTPFGLRDAAVFAVMIGTGLRRFEVSALDLGDYRAPTHVGKDPVVLVVRAGKGKKHAEVIGPPDVAVAIERWIALRGRSRGALFWSSGGRGRPLESGSRLSPAGVYLVVYSRGAEARVELAPHDLRRTFITRFIEETKDLALAQKAARHSNPKTTSKYDMRGDEELAAAFRRTSSGFIPSSRK